MKLIDMTFTNRGFAYRQIAREGDWAVYEQSKGEVKVWEVVRIRAMASRVWPSGSITPEQEFYPSSKTWGKDGFTCQTRERAFARLNEMLECPDCVLP